MIKPIRKLIQAIYSIYAILTFIGLMLVLFPFIVIGSFFGKIKGGNIIYSICSFWCDCWFVLIGMWAPKTNPPKDGVQYIFVANHISYMDVPMIVKVIRQPLRALGKAELSKVPIFGFLYRYGAILVERSDPEKRRKSVMQLKSVLKKGISIFIFPEGTFNETGKPLKDFYDGAFRIALETQTPIMPLIFPDTVKRLHYRSVFAFSPGKCRAIFLEPVPVEGLTNNDLPVLKETVYKAMEKALLEYEVK
ncbi:MAG: lysophospholipid acyltransferase family protein [Chitinophagaceae bacterium]